ncbi:MAG: ATP phosphoribosyltransferase, partial [Candidatus Latescibacteria bacterium]|nr:ATP phosphoribosyltransferase [Candidatus Latescibacterota bacterium]
MNFTLGLPNGSMQQPVFDLLARIGLDIRPSGRSGQVAIGGLELFSQAVLMRPQDIPLALLQGKIDSAICGLDCIVETELAEKVAANTKIKRLQELDLSRNTRQSMRVILFGRPDSPPLTQDISISSEYPAITQKHYPNTQISFSHGSTEIKVAMKQFDYGVGVAETGSSLRDNGLQVAEEIMVSPTMFVANKCLPEFIALGDLIAGALEAESHQLIK